MERKTQNLEFAQKLSAKVSEETNMGGAQKLFGLSRPPCASGGDIAAAQAVALTNNNDNSQIHCNSMNSSLQNLSMQAQASDDDGECEMDVPLPMEQAAMDAHLDIKMICNEGGRKAKFDEMGSKLNAELSKYKRELKSYNTTTKGLEDKYHKINCELSEMQQKHERFVANRNMRHSNDTDAYSDSSSTSNTGSEFSLKRKYTQVFNRGSSFLMVPSSSQHSHDDIPYGRNLKSTVCDVPLPRKQRKHHCQSVSSCPLGSSAASLKPRRYSKRKKHENKENDQPTPSPPPPTTSSSHNRLPSMATCQNGRNAGLKDIYKVLKNVLDTNQKCQSNSAATGKELDFRELQSTVTTLQNEQVQFRNIIQQQQNCLQDYHSRCMRAQKIMQTQQIEIDKLNSNNHQLESEISCGIDQLRLKIDSKLRDVSHLPQMMREEQSKYEKVTKENGLLGDRLRGLQNEASQLKLKMEELGRRKALTINRLKAAERDLKIFKNYNTALKHEKRKLNDELLKLKEQLETLQNSSKRTLARQREQSEKQRRELQKRVFELELKLSRSQNSTTSLVQERDSLIAELQTQLNTLVHNFEVSQKHIRVLRRHIYTLSGGASLHSHSRIINDTM